MGCLLAPFRALGCLVIVAGVAAAWLYRDRVLAAALQPSGRRREPTAAIGRPGTRALGAARARADSVRRGIADSVVLSATETASLIGDGLEPSVRRQLDSLEVRLLDGEIEVGARVESRRLPLESLGPLGLTLHARERVRAAGPLRVAGPGRGEWRIDRLDVAGVPLPRDAVAPVLGRALGDSRGFLPVAIPSGVRDIRIRPSGAVLFGARNP